MFLRDGMLDLQLPCLKKLVLPEKAGTAKRKKIKEKFEFVKGRARAGRRGEKLSLPLD